MVVAGLTIDPANNAPIVLLREKQSERVLPIWIGVVEASAIAFELESIKLTRPLTHDLLRDLIGHLGGKVDRVVIADLRDNTYFAVIVVTQGERTIDVDARPSDAIALALRAHAPILCEDAVIAQAQVRRDAQPPTKAAGANGEEDDRGEGGPRPIIDSGDKSWQDLLESLDPDAFGKYKM